MEKIKLFGEKMCNRMVENALIQVGNTYRFRRVLKKMREDEEVNIAFIGGSITEGEGAEPNSQCFASCTYEAMRQQFAKNPDKVHMINAGMCGTPSSLGIIRYNRDVLSELRGTKPDMVFIEFAVNDGDQDIRDMNLQTYESLIRRIYNEPNQPAVCLVFSVFRNQWNMQLEYIPVGEAYQLPMVSIKDMICPEINEGNMKNADFFREDGLHPTNLGHALMAQAIMNCLIQMEQQVDEDDIEMPAKTVYGNQFENIQMLDASMNQTEFLQYEAKVTIGGFDTYDTSTGQFLYHPMKSKFPYNWRHTKGTSQASFLLDICCKNILLVYKLSSDPMFGKADVLLDGKLVSQIDAYNTDGWNNAKTICILEDNEDQEHSVEIRMSEGEEDKDFTILALGYSRMI